MWWKLWILQRTNQCTPFLRNFVFCKWESGMYDIQGTRFLSFFASEVHEMPFSQMLCNWQCLWTHNNQKAIAFPILSYPSFNPVDSRGTKRSDNHSSPPFSSLCFPHSQCHSTHSLSTLLLFSHRFLCLPLLLLRGMFLQAPIIKCVVCLNHLSWRCFIEV